MPRNGSGVYSRSNGVFTGSTVWASDRDADVKIRADRHDTHDQDIADALTQSLSKDGQTTPTANLPMGTFKHTGVGDATARNHYAAAGQVQDGAFIWCGTAAGTADAITLGPTPSVTALTAGLTLRWIAGDDANTGAMTIAVSGLDAVAAENDGSALVAGDHAARKMYEGIYDGTAFQIQRVHNLLTSANTFTKTQTWAKGSDVASAAALTLGDGNYFDITGTTAITSIGTKGVGTVVKLHFDGALTLTHHATDLILPGGANITTAAGDEAEFVEYATGDWRCTSYSKASGAPVAGSLPRSYLAGLTLSNNATDASHDIDIAVGEARDSGNTADIVLASALTKRIDASWAVGTNQGGLDGSESVDGTPDADTWYHVWLIKRSDTGVVDALFSESATAPTMPTDYDLKRRIGAVLTDGSANILGFVQEGDLFQWKDPPLDVTAAGPGASAVTRTLSVPTGVRVIAWIHAQIEGDQNGCAYISDLDINDEAASATAAPLSTTGIAFANDINVGGQAQVRTNTSGQIRSRLSIGAAVETLYIATLGWLDSRGRND